MSLKAVAAYLLRHAFVRFALVGAGGYAVNAAMLALGTHVLHLAVEAALAFAIFVAMCCTWLGNRYLTFPDRRAHGVRGIAEEGLRFAGANLVGALVNYAVAVALVRWTTGLAANPYVAQMLGVLAGLIFNFTLSRALVFKGRA